MPRTWDDGCLLNFETTITIRCGFKNIKLFSGMYDGVAPHNKSIPDLIVSGVYKPVSFFSCSCVSLSKTKRRVT